VLGETLRIATRKSPLALWQARFIQKQLGAHHPNLTIDLLPLTTSGDLRLPDHNVKALFTKELDIALRQKHADIAVHSMKDVATNLPDDLMLPVICHRQDPRDVLVSTVDSLAQLKNNACIGTSSLRRQAQLKALRRDLIFQPLHGNIETRLQKLFERQFDAIILASAGLTRLNKTNLISCYLDLEQCLPAPGQGALGIVCRRDDLSTLEIIKPLTDFETFQCVTSERALSRHLGGSCRTPIAAYAQINHQQLSLRARVGRDGVLLNAWAVSSITQPELLGIQVAEDLLNQGALKFLKQ
jgi:hydroxymethylbilane synthase